MSYSNNDGLGGQNLGALSADGGQSKDAKRKSGNKPTKRVVNRQLLLAALLAIIAAVGVLLYVTASGPEGAYVVTTKTEVGALQPVTASNLSTVFVPKELIVTGAFQGANAEEAMATVKSLVDGGMRTKYPLKLNQQLSESDFGADLALDAPLKDGERLLSISASVVNGVAGQLTAGDTVDIFGTAATGGGNGDVTGLLASNVPVVSVTVDEAQFAAAGSKQAKATDTVTASEVLPANPIAPGIYVIRVSAKDAANIATVQQSGKLYMAYRTPDSPNLDPSVQSAEQALCSVNPGATACTTAP